MSDKVTSECPTQIELQSLLDDSIPIDETISGHLATCEDCQRELDLLTDSAELNFYRRHSADQSDAGRFLAPPIREGDLGLIDDFAIERQIGSGGMGVVFQGRDDRLNRKIAVKILSRRTGSTSDARFEREAKAAAKLSHDHIVPVYSSNRTADGTPYLVMQLIEGPSLKDRIESGPIKIREAADLVRQIALGLQAAHERDLVHRDVKPGNILIDSNDNRAKLTDFGLARTPDDQTLTQADVVSGTPQYMSPEQILNPGTQDQRSDVYSLGITLYECLTGTSPFRGQPIQVLEQHRHTEPIRPSRLNDSVPADLDNICLMSIAKDAGHRYQTAGQFAEDLQRYLDGRPVMARDTTRYEKFRMWCGRNPGIATLTAAVFGLLLMLGIGSTIAAFNLRAANKTILAEKQKATVAEQHANNDRTAAVNSLETLVNSLYDELSNDAATIKTREKVVTAAIDGLKSITQVSGDRKADRTTFQAYLRIGDLTSLRGADEEAVENYSKAIELARLLLSEQPNDALAKRELAMACSQFGLHHFRRGNFSESHELDDECQALLSEVLSENPDDFDALVRLVLQHGYKLSLIRQETQLDAQQVIQYGVPTLDDVDRMIAIKSDNGLACEAAHAVHFCLGRAYLESNKVELANEHFKVAKSYLNVALKQTPERADLNSALAVLNRAHAMVYGALGQMDEAIVLFEDVVDTFKTASASDPDDTNQKTSVADSQALLGLANNSSGRFDDAIKVFDESLSSYKSVLEITPESFHSMRQLIVVGTQKFQAQMSLFRWSDVKITSHNILKEIEGLDLGPESNGFVQNYSAYANVTTEAMNWLLGEGVEKKTVDGEHLALMLAVRQDAMSSTSDQLSAATLELTKRASPKFEGKTFPALFDYLKGLPGVTPPYMIQRKNIEGSVYGLLARNCDQSDQADIKRKSKELLQRVLDLIEAESAAYGYAAIREPVLNNPDLNWVRQTPEFQKIWKEAGGQLPSKQ